MASGIDNFGFGQNKMDKPYVDEVIGHLVDKKNGLASLNSRH
ncbi:MAG: hypothetical protein ACJAZ0_002975 [Halioglobus sp.]